MGRGHEPEPAPSEARADVLLHWLCLARSRSEAAGWCHEGRVLLGGRPVKASHPLRAGEVLTLRVGGHPASYRILEVPRAQVPRAGRERYLRQEP